MSRLPAISGQKLVNALCRVGYRVVRQRGSHVRLRCEDDPARLPVTVPLHREVRRGTLLAILADANLSREQLAELLD